MYGSERSIFQTFWKPDSCPDFLFFELEASNFEYCLFFNVAKVCKIWARLNKLFIGHFTRVPPLNFGGLMESKKIKGGDPSKMSYIKFVQSGWNFAQFSKFKKQASSQSLKSLTQKTKNRGNYQVFRRFGKYSFSIF